MFVEALYAATQQGRTITISPDFTGQMTISDETGHVHAGVSQGPLDRIAIDGARWLSMQQGDRA